VDLARALPLRAGVVVADSALRLRLTGMEALRDTVLECRHFEGIGQAARTCEFADAGSESPLESESRVELQLRGVPKPELQHSFYDSDGFVGRTDMYWKEQRVVGQAAARSSTPSRMEGDRQARCCGQKRDVRIDFARWALQ